MYLKKLNTLLTLPFWSYTSTFSYEVVKGHVFFYGSMMIHDILLKENVYEVCTFSLSNEGKRSIESIIMICKAIFISLLSGH